MALPVMNTAKYEMELPSTGDKIEYRPFLVKEEKVLLQAMEGGDEKEIMRGLKQVISQCVLTKSYKVDRSPVFDLEYIFLKLRSKAVGEPPLLLAISHFLALKEAIKASSVGSMPELLNSPATPSEILRVLKA